MTKLKLLQLLEVDNSKIYLELSDYDYDYKRISALKCCFKTN